ncbi:hypothetical protein [Streptomyces sp. NPDC058745]|uniref:hypothetical protein n=1 Tax=Streptomyces sp. NPDC058745 TaxID=3346621 RepID=UPI0036895148
MAANYDRLIERARLQDGDLDETSVLAGLLVVRVLRDKLLLDERRLIQAARSKKITWSRIADALEMRSRQAAERRYLQLREDLDDVAHDSLTQAERVEVARTTRHRFTEYAWASSHAARIAGLAIQLDAVPHLQERADRSPEGQAARKRAVNDAIYRGEPVPEPTPMPWPGRLRHAVEIFEAHTCAASASGKCSHPTPHEGDALLHPAALNKLLHELFGLIGHAMDSAVVEDRPDLIEAVRALYAEAGAAAPRLLPT